MTAQPHEHHTWQKAASFAARRHQGQFRKDGETPYFAHPARVALTVRHLFGVDDPVALCTALLHDTIEDTTTDFDDLAELFGHEVARWVAQLSKDKRMEDGAREEDYKATLAESSWQVKVCKLGDLFDNLLDSRHIPPERQSRTLARSRSYLEALNDPTLPPEARRAHDVVDRLLKGLEGRTD